MSQDRFFESISEHYEKQLPFVVYCKPSSFHVHALLQKNDVLFKISDYNESGFVMAPFDFRKDNQPKLSDRIRKSSHHFVFK